MESCHRFITTQHLYDPLEVQDGDSQVCFRFHLKGRLHFFGKSKGHTISDAHPSGIETILSLSYEEKMHQLKALCFGLSSAPQFFARVFVLVYIAVSVTLVFSMFF